MTSPSPLRLAMPAPAASCVVGGVRVSTDAQADRYGPERQRQEITREADRVGLTVWQWVEESVSGANHDRAAENAYYDLARLYPGLNFMFSHPNRVGRHVEVTVGIARQIHALGGTVWIAGLGNLRDERNWKYFIREAAEAEIDYTNIVNQLYAGKRDKAIEGRWPHGAPPWGYKLRRDERGDSILPEIVPAFAPSIRRVFDLSEQFGGGIVTQMMREEGWPAPTAAGWTRCAVSNTVRNARYTGRLVFAGVEVLFPGIISVEQFERVAQKRTLRLKENGQRTRQVDVLLAGHVRCAECGAALGRETHRNKWGQYSYYRCWRARRTTGEKEGAQPCANKSNWRAGELDALCWAELVEHITTPDLLAQIVTSEPILQTTPPTERLQELEAAIARAWEPFAAGLVPQGVAERLAAPFTAELEALKAEYARQPKAKARDLNAVALQFRDAIHEDMTLDQKRRLLAALDVRFIVGSDGLKRISLSIP